MAASDIIAQAQAYAADMREYAIQRLDQAISHVTTGDAFDPIPDGTGDITYTPINPTVTFDIDTDGLPDPFDDEYVPPPGEPSRPTSLLDPYIPKLPDYAGLTAPTLNTSGLFQTPKPTFTLDGFHETLPTVKLEFTIPPAPPILFPNNPTIGEVTVSEANITDVTIVDPDKFTDTYAEPNSDPGAFTLETAYLPKVPVFGTAPGDLNTSTLFQTPKPSWTLADFDGGTLDVDTSLDYPGAPTLSYPAEPGATTKITLSDLNLTDVTIDDPDDFTETYVPPTSHPGTISLDNAYVPTMDDPGDAPPELNYSTLFQTPKPGWTLTDFTGQVPSVDTEKTIPGAPEFTYPKEPGDATAITIPNSNIVGPTIADPNAFTGAYVPPTSDPGDVTFEGLYIPTVDSFGTTPADLNTSALFQTPKPTWTLGDFTDLPPEVDTEKTVPPAPTLDYPTAPPVTAVTVSDSTAQKPTITDPDEFTDEYHAPSVVPTKPTNYETLVLPGPLSFEDAPDALDTSNLFQTIKPTWTLADFTTGAPTINTTFEIDDPPPINFGDEPTVHNLDIGTAPTISLPSFTDEFTGVAPTAQTTLADQLVAKYDAALPEMKAFIDSTLTDWAAQYGVNNSVSAQTQLAGKIATDLTGGTGIPVAVENAIYSRARARVDAEQAAAMNQVTSVMTKRGYVYPPGALAAAVGGMLKEYANRLAQFATETAIEKAKMEQQHAQFVMNLSSQLQQAATNAAVQYAGVLVQVNGQALEYSKVFAQNLAEVFNQQLAVYNAKIEIWKVQAQVFETKLKSALAALDKYRLELEVAKAKKDVEALQVQVFEARIRAQMSKLEVYSAQVNVVKLRADMERLKIELFNGQVQAYLGQVQAQTSKFGAYKAAVEGDVARVQGYVAEVEGYKAGVDAEAAKGQAGIARSQAIIAHNTSLDERFRIELEKYKVDVQAEQARFEAAVSAYRTGLEAYQAAVDAKIRKYDTEIKEAQHNLEIVKAKKDVEKTDVELYTAKIQALVAKTEVHKNALAGLNSEVELEKLKVSAFDAEVQAFLGAAQAQTAKFEAYKTATQGDIAIVDGYKAQVEAFGTKVSAIGKKADVDIAHSQAIIAHNQAKADQYKAELEKYKTDIQAEQARYGASIDAYRASLDAYKAAMDGKIAKFKTEIEQAQLNVDLAKAKKDVEKLDVDLYAAKIAALQARNQVFVGELESAKLELDAEKLKLDVFGAQVEAYMTTTKAQDAKFGAYKTATEADTAIVEGYRAEVGAFAAKVDAVGKKADVEIAHSRAIGELNQAKIDEYKVKLERYRTDVEAEKGRMTIAVEAYRAKLDGYQAAIKARIDKLDVEIKEAEANIELAKAKKDIEKVDVDLYVAKLDALKTRNDVYQGQLKSVEIQASIEKLKVDLFQGQVEAYSMQARAQEAKFSAFEAATRGDIALVDGYKAKVDGYQATVQAEGLKHENEVAHSKAIAEYNQGLIEKFRAELDRYKTDIQAEQARFGTSADAYKTALSAYEAAIRGKLAKLDAEVKEAQINIDVAKAKTEVDANEVRTFAAQIDALKTKAEVWRTQLEGVKTEADVERLKVDLFKGKVDAYIAQATAESKKFEAYEAATKGDIAVVDGYSSQVTAYKTGIEAAVAKAEADAQHGKIIIDSNKGILEMYQTELAAYKTKIEAETTRFGGSAEAYRMLLQGYIQELQAKTAVLDAQMKAKKMDMEAVVTEAELATKIGLGNAEIASKGIQHEVSLANTMAGMLGNMSSAALSGINSLAVAEDA